MSGASLSLPFAHPLSLSLSYHGTKLEMGVKKVKEKWSGVFGTLTDMAFRSTNKIYVVGLTVA